MDTLKPGSKRIKLAHDSVDGDNTAASHPTISKLLTSLDPAVTEATEDLQRKEVLDTSTGSSGQGTRWTNLKRLGSVLRSASVVFEPLKSTVEAMSDCVEIFENESINRREYDALRVELESLFDDLTCYLDGSPPPAIADIVAKITVRIQKDIQVILQKRVRWMNKQWQNLRIKELPNSPAATYMSAQSDSIGRGACTPNTRAEVLQQMHNWAYDSSSQRVYWLNGMAGTGKTTIAYSACAQLDRTRKLAASFFCSRQLPECRDVNRIIPSIAYQFSVFSRPFQRALSDLLGVDPEAHNRPISMQFEQLLVEPLQDLAAEFPADRVIIIDALDECDDKEGVNRLLDVILGNDRTLPIRFIITSRPEAKIQDRMIRKENEGRQLELRLHELEHSTVCDDIKTYLTVELSGMNLSSAQIDILVQKSGLLFIYAATVARYIVAGGFSLSAGRLDEVLNTTVSHANEAYREIDALYALILGSAFSDPSHNMSDKNSMMLLLRTIVCAQEPLTVNTIAGLTGLDVDTGVRPRLRPMMSVLYLSEQTGIVTILHESFLEYMLNNSRSREFYCDPRLYHRQMALMCFDVIHKQDPPFNICHLSSSYLFDEDVPGLSDRREISISDACFYACRYWGAHAALCQSSQTLVQSLELFLFNRLFLWLEVLNLKNCVSDGTRTLHNGAHTSGCSSKSRELMRDAQNFITVLFSGEVFKSTPHIYMSGLAFWPANRPIWKHYKKYVAGLVGVEGMAMKMQESALVARIEVEEDPWCIAYSPDGAYVITGHSNSVQVRNAYTGQLITRLKIEDSISRINSVACSPNSTFIVSGSSDAILRGWSFSGSQQVEWLAKGHSDSISCVAYSPSGAYVVSGSSDKTMRVWDAQTGQQFGKAFEGHTDALTPLVGHTGCVNSVSYSPTGKHIVSGSDDTTVRTWDAQTGHQVGRILEATFFVNVVTYSPDGTRIAAGTENGDDIGDIRIWSVETGQLVGVLCDSYDSGIRSLVYSPDGVRIISCTGDSDDSGICIWNAQLGGSRVSSRLGGFPSIYAVTYSPDGAFLASIGPERNAICIWDAETGERLGHSMKGHKHYISSIAYSPDGTRIVSGSYDRTIRIWCSYTGRQIGNPIKYHTSSLLSVACSPNGGSIATGSIDGTIQIWCAHTGQQIGTPLKGHTSAVTSIVYSASGALLASGSQDMTLRIWNVHTRSQIGAPLSGHTNRITSVSYSPCCNHIISGSWDKTVRIWDAFTGKQIGDPLTGHTDRIESVAYSPTGDLIASGSFDRTVRVWHAYNGHQLGEPLQGHMDLVESVVFSPCGRFLASGSTDGVIRVWSAPTSQMKTTSRYYLDHGLASPIHTPNIPDFCHIVPTELVLIQRNNYEYRDEWALREDGWVVADGHKLLIWIPPNLRTYLMRPRNSRLLSEQGSLRLNFSTAKLGSRWSECYQRAL
ncbi:Notchless protein [Ceratobasidium sp. AG-Ba]|nr:Notchless protein [Ceratobasidium sp. AG-Ba]